MGDDWGEEEVEARGGMAAREVAHRGPSAFIPVEIWKKVLHICTEYLDYVLGVPGRHSAWNM